MNIILQHWLGEHTEVEEGSWKSIEDYANAVGAQHRVLRGAFFPAKSPQIQKLHMLDPEFDQHDVVVMLDSDMFARPGAKSIFEASGIGVSEDFHAKLKASIRSRVPHRFTDKDGDFYGGAVYRLERAERKALRKHLNPEVIRDFDAYAKGVDEGVVHYLACEAGFKGRGLSEGDLWACSSYSEERTRAHFVHIRRRVKEGSEERRPKVEVLKELISLGVL